MVLDRCSDGKSNHGPYESVVHLSLVLGWLINGLSTPITAMRQTFNSFTSMKDRKITFKKKYSHFWSYLPGCH